MNPSRFCIGSFIMFLWNLSLLSKPAASFVPSPLFLRSRTAAASSSYIQRFYADDSKRKRNLKKHNKANIQVPTWVPDEVDESGYSRPVIQWYPGHIAKAERLLKETFQAVDVVVEVRDARAPKATSHPKVEEWCSGRPRLVVFTHVDIVPPPTHRAWKTLLQQEGETEETSNSADAKIPEQFLWVNAKQGQGIPALHRAIFKAGAHVQERRQRRGLKDRPLRVGLMGSPNVGKSALIVF
jgi:GTP-binding protein EngB required for normal cell division